MKENELTVPQEIAKLCFDYIYAIVKNKKKTKECCKYMLDNMLTIAKQYSGIGEINGDLHKSLMLSVQSKHDISALTQAIKEIEKQ